MMFGLIPTRAAIWAVLAAVAGGLIALIRVDAKRDQRREAELKDYEHAEDIDRRVSDGRADPERLRQYDGAGWRD